MNTLNARALAVAAVIGLGGATATAGSLDLDAVSADATWLVHVDVERFVDSTLGRFVIENSEALDIDVNELREMEEQLAINLWEDVMSVTLYGVGEDDDEGVVVAVTNHQIDEDWD